MSEQRTPDTSSILGPPFGAIHRGQLHLAYYNPLFESDSNPLILDTLEKRASVQNLMFVNLAVHNIVRGYHFGRLLNDTRPDWEARMALEPQALPPGTGSLEVADRLAPTVSSIGAHAWFTSDNSVSQIDLTLRPKQSHATRQTLVSLVTQHGHANNVTKTIRQYRQSVSNPGAGWQEVAPPITSGDVTGGELFAAANILAKACDAQPAVFLPGLLYDSFIQRMGNLAIPAEKE